jgi:hypothetical protein
MAKKATLLRDIEKVTERLAVLGADRDRAVAKAVYAGCTWSAVGGALGVSAQAAHKRFRSVRHDPGSGVTWREPQLPL